MNITWNKSLVPDDTNLVRLGINTATNSPARIGARSNILVVGASGTGKSWVLRTLIANAVTRGDAITILDPKGTDAALWEGIAPVATTTKEIREAIEATWEEMNNRHNQMKNSKASTFDGPTHTLVADEGFMITQALKGGGEHLGLIGGIARTGKSTGHNLWWTASNLLSTSLPASMRAHMDYEIHLNQAASIPTQRNRDLPGIACIAGASPTPIAIDVVDDDTLRSLKSQA